MIWDGKSPGTVLNVLRLVRGSKKAVLINVPEQRQDTFKSKRDWDAFLWKCDATLCSSLKTRALPGEWFPSDSGQAPLGLSEAAGVSGTSHARPSLDRRMDAALAAGDPKAFVDCLGRMARERGMSRDAQETGLAREALYRALSADGNPALATVLKAAGALGIQLSASRNSGA